MKKDNRVLYIEALNLVGKELLEHKQRQFLLRLIKKHSGNSGLTKKEEFQVTCESVLDHLNQVAGTGYRASSTATRAFIRARLNDGFKVEDFKHVIDIKAKHWLGGDKEGYLRPQTLFGPKSEGYLQEWNKTENKRIKQEQISKSRNSNEDARLEPHLQLTPEEIKQNEAYKIKAEEIIKNHTEDEWLAFYKQLKVLKTEAYSKRLKHPIVRRMFVGWKIKMNNLEDVQHDE